MYERKSCAGILIANLDDFCDDARMTIGVTVLEVGPFAFVLLVLATFDATSLNDGYLCKKGAKSYTLK